MNLITSVPTTDIKFFIDKDGEVRRASPPNSRRGSPPPRAPPTAAIHRAPRCAARAAQLPMDENKALADQKIENDSVIYMIYKKEGSDEWESIDVGKPAEGGEPMPQ